MAPASQIPSAQLMYLPALIFTFITLLCPQIDTGSQWVKSIPVFELTSERPPNPHAPDLKLPNTHQGTLGLTVPSEVSLSLKFITPPGWGCDTPPRADLEPRALLTAMFKAQKRVFPVFWLALPRCAPTAVNSIPVVQGHPLLGSTRTAHTGACGGSSTSLLSPSPLPSCPAQQTPGVRMNQHPTPRPQGSFPAPVPVRPGTL